jgi:TolB protein
MNADGTGEQRLTDNASFDGRPAWSPDGRRIAFESNRDGEREIYVMNADGSAQVRVTDGGRPAEGMVSWSRDGSKIIFRRQGQGAGMIVVHADGSGYADVEGDPRAPADRCP